MSNSSLDDFLNLHLYTHSGSWRRGIGPDERNADAVPSINEMEKLRIADEKKEEVQKWLEADAENECPTEVEFEYFPRVPCHDPTWDKYQPDTSNAAMQRFLDRARDIEAASVTATISSLPGSITNRPRKSSILDTFKTPSLLKSGVNRHLFPAIREAISSSQPGLSELMTDLGGPPMLSLPDADSDASEVDDHTFEVVPTLEGFLHHAVEVCKNNQDFIVKRAAQLHYRRYKQLLDQKAQHWQRVRSGNCSPTYCPDLGGQPKALPGPSVHLSIHLPAEFECPFCFQVRRFEKPSDWTQHLQCDIEPYFCTFQDCDCVRTWGRKADWKRHMVERHLQLETFKCKWRDCGKEVARRSNFLQHCLREHRVPVPKQQPKTQEFKDMVARVRSGEYLIDWEDDFLSAGDHTTKVWLIVHACRQEKMLKPEDEPCCFCGTRSGSWKAVFAHLARHMEVMSMPIPRLVQSKDVDGLCMDELRIGLIPRQ